MDKSKKTLLFIIIIIMAFISVIALIYGINNVRNSQAAADAENLQFIEVAQNSIEECKKVSSQLDDCEDYDTAIKYYTENIENAENPKLKAYIANSMLTYAINYISIKSIEFEATGSVNGTVSPYQNILKTLNTTKSQVDSLI